MRKVLLLIVGLICGTAIIQAQETWDLDKCVSYALENSNDVKSIKLSLENAKLTTHQAKMSRLPSLNANSNFGWNFGRQVDPSTNDFISQQLSFNSIGLGSSVTLFNGKSISNTIKKSKIDEEAAGMDAKAIINNLKLSIVQSYVAILLAEEQVANAQTRVATAQEQLTNTDKLIAAGSVPRNDRLQILANLATEEQNVIIAENNVDLNYNLLKQFLQLDPGYNIRIEKPTSVIPIETSLSDVTFEEIYKIATSTLPEVQAQDLKIKSAEMDVDIAKANLVPTLSLSGNIGTNFSSAGKQFDFTSQSFTQGENVLIDGSPALIERVVEVDVPTITDKPYFDQLNENFGQGVSLGLSIPIFNGKRAQTAVDRSKLQIENLRIQKEQTLNNIKSDVQRAINNARAAKLQLEAAQRSLEAQEANYDNIQKRYNLGAISTFEYVTAKNSLDSAQFNETISRFDYIFKVKVLDFYQGKRLTIN